MQTDSKQTEGAVDVASSAVLGGVRTKTGIPKGLPKSEYKRQWDALRREKIREYWRNWWSEKGKHEPRPSLATMAFACKTAARATPNAELSKDLMAAGKLIEKFSKSQPPNAPHEPRRE